MEHITNDCKVSNNLWRQHQDLFEMSDKEKNNVKITIEKWRNKPYQNIILNRAWKLSLRFVMLNIWKERNHLTFKEDGKAKDEIWNQITQNIRETILT